MIPERWPHQEQTFQFYGRTPYMFDLSSPGSGKSRAAIDAFVEYANKRALIIAPKSLLDSAWGDDIDKFQPDLRYSIAWAKNRIDAFSTPADVYITNTDAAKWLAKRPKKFFDSFDTLIVDESSDFKHHTSQRSKALRKISKYFDRRALLTGTPTSRSITDIWHQALILDGGQRLGKSFVKFRDVVCKPEYVNPAQPNWVKWVDKPEARDSVAQILSDVTIRHKFEEVMPDVPGNTEHMVFYRPSAKLMALYEQLKEEAIVALKDGTVNAVNAAVLRGKLLQLASGAVYGELGKVHTIDDGRVELVVDLVREREHSIVFYNWDHQRESLIKALEARKIAWAEITRHTRERNAIVRAYQAGEYQTLLMHPQTGAHGLTLTRGTATIWCSPTDRADLLVQGKHRVHRGSQTQETENVMVSAVGTIEKSVYQRTTDKRDAMVELMEMLEGEK